MTSPRTIAPGTVGLDMCLSEIHRLHEEFPLSCEHGSSLLSLPDDQLLYLLALLRNETPALPVMAASEWTVLITTLKEHLILPVLYSKVAALPDAVRPPAEVVGQLRSCYLQSSVCSLKQERQLRMILLAFADKGIQPVLLKGAAYSLTIYPEPAMRPSIDIDILVKQGDVIECRELLKRLGYTCLENHFDVSRTGYHDEVFMDLSDPGQKIVELHWSLNVFYLVSQQMATEQFFQRARKVEATGMSFYVLDPVDALIHTSIHTIYAHSDTIKLNWIYDISLLCKALKCPSDWERLQQSCVENCARIAVEKALVMAQCWTDLQIPPEFADLSQWPEPASFEFEVYSLAVKRRTGNLIGLMFPKSAGFREKIIILCHLVFPSREIMGRFYPESRGKALYKAYLFRWWELLKKL